MWSINSRASSSQTLDVGKEYYVVVDLGDDTSTQIAAG